MWHQADHITGFIAKAGNIIHRTIGIGAFAMRRGAGDNAAFYGFVGEESFERIWLKPSA